MLCTLIGAIILSINIQVGLNMHLYDDIGVASSSLRGSTSSYYSVDQSKTYFLSTISTHFSKSILNAGYASPLV